MDEYSKKIEISVDVKPVLDKAALERAKKEAQKSGKPVSIGMDFHVDKDKIAKSIDKELKNAITKYLKSQAKAQDITQRITDMGLGKMTQEEYELSRDNLKKLVSEHKKAIVEMVDTNRRLERSLSSIGVGFNAKGLASIGIPEDAIKQLTSASADFANYEKMAAKVREVSSKFNDRATGLRNLKYGNITTAKEVSIASEYRNLVKSLSLVDDDINDYLTNNNVREFTDIIHLTENQLDDFEKMYRKYERLYSRLRDPDFKKLNKEDLSIFSDSYETWTNYFKQLPSQKISQHDNIRENIKEVLTERTDLNAEMLFKEIEAAEVEGKRITKDTEAKKKENEKVSQELSKQQKKLSDINKEITETQSSVDGDKAVERKKSQARARKTAATEEADAIAQETKNVEQETKNVEQKKANAVKETTASTNGKRETATPQTLDEIGEPNKAEMTAQVVAQINEELTRIAPKATTLKTNFEEIRPALEQDVAVLNGFYETLTKIDKGGKKYADSIIEATKQWVEGKKNLHGLEIAYNNAVSRQSSDKSITQKNTTKVPPAATPSTISTTTTKVSTSSSLGGNVKDDGGGGYIANITGFTISETAKKILRDKVKGIKDLIANISDFNITDPAIESLKAKVKALEGISTTVGDFSVPDDIDEKVKAAVQKEINALQEDFKEARSLAKDLGNKVNNQRKNVSTAYEKGIKNGYVFSDDESHIKDELLSLSNRLDSLIKPKVNASEAELQAYIDEVNEIAEAFKNVKTAADEAREHIDKFAKDKTANTAAINLSKKWDTAFRSFQQYLQTNPNTRTDTNLNRMAEGIIFDFQNTEQSAERLAKLNREISEYKLRAHQGGLEGKKFSQVLKEMFEKFGSWGIVTRIMMLGYNTIRKMFTATKEVDTAMVNLRKVSDETEESYTRFLRNATKEAKELGTTITELTEATATFARLGYNLADSTELGKIATMYSKVAENLSPEEASNSIISTMKAFKIGADEAERIVDEFNYVGEILPLHTVMYVEQMAISVNVRRRIRPR